MESTHPAPPPLTAEGFAPPGALRRLQGPALVAGVAGLALAGVGLVVDRAHFFQAWLVGWVFWVSIALGAMGLLMLQHMTGGAWGVMLRRPLEAAMRTLPMLALGFVPVLAGMHDLYHWTHEEVVRADAFLTAKAPYLNAPFFIGRTIFYFAVWLLFAWQLDRSSRRQDQGDTSLELARRTRGWSAAGFLTLALTGSFAAIDWLMSLDPHWFSSLYGLWFFTGMGLSALTFSVLVAGWLSRRPPMQSALRPRHFHDWGKLFFAFVMLWAYLSFSQYLLMWSGNLPEEIPFYLRRMSAPWGLISAVLLVGHFVLPFLVLLSADLKQRARMLVKVALWVLAMRWLDYYWNVAPTLQALHDGSGGGHAWSWSGLWIDLAALVGLGGIWLWLFLRQLAKRPLLPVNDPYLPEALSP